jgi:hypothetical protein
VTNRADWLGRSVAATILAGLILLRRAYVEPRDWVWPRAAAALLLRIWAFLDSHLSLRWWRWC